MFSPDLLKSAEKVLSTARRKNIKIATAESCTGGLVIGCLTEIAGSSDVVDRGFITYSNEAKIEVLDVPPAMLQTHGAVSEPVALTMAAGALAHSQAQIAIAVTGIAGPDGGSIFKPVGLVYMAGMRSDGVTLTERHEFGNLGREMIRLKTVQAALTVINRLL